VNNSKNNNKVGKYPIAGLFRLVDGFVVVVVFDLAEMASLSRLRLEKVTGREGEAEGKQLPVILVPVLSVA
jgi:hypothetical protein